MDELKTKFLELVRLIQRVVAERIANGLIKPDAVLMNRWKARQYAETDTGVAVSESQFEQFTKTDWRRAEYKLFGEIPLLKGYKEFVDALAACTGKDVAKNCSDALHVLIGKTLNGDEIKLDELLAQLISHIHNEPFFAWCDIDIYGVAVKGVKEVSFGVDDSKYTFRQLELSDFEQPYPEHPGALSGTSFGHGIAPSCILRVEMKIERHIDAQMRVAKIMTLIRLFRVCSAKFGREAFGRSNPFLFPFGTKFRSDLIHPGNHVVMLNAESAIQLERFWKAASPKLPAGLTDYGPKETTPIFIAYERYCDSIFTNNLIERKIAFAIMGLESIFLGKSEVSELMYRMELRVGKFLSKLGFSTVESRSNLKEGYKIRNSYVHGGHLSEKDRKKLMDKNIAPDALARSLLDYLRIAILHLIVSQQPKEQLLDLLEESFIERSKDDQLEALLAANVIFREI